MNVEREIIIRNIANVDDLGVSLVTRILNDGQIIIAANPTVIKRDEVIEFALLQSVNYVENVRILI
ncbi:hypothetical protein SAMN05444422_11110 [Halobiforma haloterrestris]|uniref:Uncharacterized protein n=1 Tax=Natronobacterium haloterrestre TaxID=148448 RepID=A0A1I1KCG4_NATHA|nr:hypothetical protein SAMN05444422_11110 [Halobiforma haloterrestris]